MSTIFEEGGKFRLFAFIVTLILASFVICANNYTLVFPQKYDRATSVADGAQHTLIEVLDAYVHGGEVRDSACEEPGCRALFEEWDAHRSEVRLRQVRECIDEDGFIAVTDERGGPHSHTITLTLRCGSWARWSVILVYRIDSSTGGATDWRVMEMESAS